MGGGAASLPSAHTHKPAIGLFLSCPLSCNPPSPAPLLPVLRTHSRWIPGSGRCNSVTKSPRIPLYTVYAPLPLRGVLQGWVWVWLQRSAGGGPGGPRTVPGSQSLGKQSPPTASRQPSQTGPALQTQPSNHTLLPDAGGPLCLQPVGPRGRGWHQACPWPFLPSFGPRSRHSLFPPADPFLRVAGSGGNGQRTRLAVLRGI